MLVPNDVGGVERGENSDLVECIFLFFVGKIVHLDFFQGVDLGVYDSLDLVNTGVGSLSQFGDDHEVLK